MTVLFDGVWLVVCSIVVGSFVFLSLGTSLAFVRIGDCCCVSPCVAFVVSELIVDCDGLNDARWLTEGTTIKRVATRCGSAAIDGGWRSSVLPFSAWRVLAGFCLVLLSGGCF